MATNIKKTTARTAKEIVDSNLIVTSDDTGIEKTTEKQTKPAKEYAPDEGILCRSITSGKLYVTGIKSHVLYEWADDGDVTEVEYQDLVAAIRSRASYIMLPRFIIEDEEFVSKFSQLSEVYESMYSIKDLRDIVTKLSPKDMKSVILSLPEGAKESIKHIASNMISNGTLDSVQKIKYLDEIFDTKMMLMTELFNS